RGHDQGGGRAGAFSVRLGQAHRRADRVVGAHRHEHRERAAHGVRGAGSGDVHQKGVASGSCWSTTASKDPSTNLRGRSRPSFAPKSRRRSPPPGALESKTPTGFLGKAIVRGSAAKLSATMIDWRPSVRSYANTSGSAPSDR